MIINDIATSSRDRPAKEHWQIMALVGGSARGKKNKKIQFEIAKTHNVIAREPQDVWQKSAHCGRWGCRAASTISPIMIRPAFVYRIVCKMTDGAKNKARIKCQRSNK